MDCVTYYQCSSDGIAYENKCPSGLSFDRTTNVCDWPDNVDCNAPKIQPNLPQTSKSHQSKPSHFILLKIKFAWVDENEQLFFYKVFTEIGS